MVSKSEIFLKLFFNVASCVGNCGVYNNSAPCQCDIHCTAFRDCCGDYGDACAGRILNLNFPQYCLVEI